MKQKSRQRFLPALNFSTTLLTAAQLQLAPQVLGVLPEFGIRLCPVLDRLIGMNDSAVVSSAKMQADRLK